MEPIKKINWLGVFVGLILLNLGILGIWHSINKPSLKKDISASGQVPYGSDIGDQYIFNGMVEAIQKNYQWNSTNYHPTEGHNYDVTNVSYNGQILLQIVPCFDCMDMSENLALYIDVPPSKVNKFRNLKYYSYFEERGEDKYYANCHNNVIMAAKIASDVLLNFFNIPSSADITYE